MAATNTTTKFGLNLTDFDKIPWGEEQHNNWHIIDALMSRFIAISLVQGAWENALAVTVGNRYIDTDADTIYEVLVAHTTPSTGTFSAARIANSSHWQAVTVDVANKGTYAQATVYAPNNFVQDGGRFGIVQTDYTSDNAAATTALSYDADVTNGDIITLIDASALIAATHDTNTVAAGGTPTATYTASTSKFNFGLVTGATGSTGPTGASGASNIVLDTTPQLGGFLDANSKFVSLSQGANIASVAGDTDIWANFDGNTVHITGTNAITDFGTPKSAGDSMWVVFDAAASVVDSATITVAGNTNYQAAANDLALVYALTTSTFLFMPFPNSGASPVATVTASTTAAGVSELATDAETITGTSTSLVVTPANIQAKVASATAKGIAELATTAETITGTDTARVITPAGLHGALAGLTDTTITAADTVVFSDATDGNALKEDTVQGILDLAGGGSLSVIATATASGSATIDFESGIDSTYDMYEVHWAGVRPGTDASFFELVVSDDGGSSYEAGTQYEYSVMGRATNHTDIVESSTGTAYFRLSGGNCLAAVESEASNSGFLKFSTPSSTTLYKHFEWYFVGHDCAATPITIRFRGHGRFDGSTAALDGIRFRFSTGTVSTGVFILYGRNKS